MAGLVAIIADRRSAPPADREIAALAAAYCDLRGGAPRHVAGPAWARVAHIDGAIAAAAQRDGPSWSVAVGAAHGDALAGAPEELDGHFALIRHRAECDELEVLNDPFGMQALFLAERPGRTYVSTSALALARHLGSEPDPVGVKLFLRAGRQFGPVTSWSGIERVAPATILCFTGLGRPRRRVYWAPELDPEVGALTLEQTIERCVDVGLDLVRRRLVLDGGVSADLTGGFDSRLVASLLDCAGARFETMTVGEESVDARIAGAVALAAGWRWHAQALPGDWTLTPERLRHCLGWSDGVLDVFNLAEVLWRQERRGSKVVAGGGGENYGPRPWLVELWRAGRSRSVRPGSSTAMVFATPGSPVLRADLRAEVEPYCHEVLTDAARPYRGELNTAQLDVMHACREVGHFGAYRSASEGAVSVEMPCYYKDLWSIAFSAHPRHRLSHRLHRGLIERLHPLVAAVETERGGPAELARAGNLHRFPPYYTRLARSGLRKLRGRPAPPSPAREPAWAAYAALTRALRDEGVLRPQRLQTAELFDTEALGRLIDAGADGRLTSWAMLGRVVTLELALAAAAAAAPSAAEARAA